VSAAAAAVAWQELAFALLVLSGRLFAFLPGPGSNKD
jgi:hypothetical protein